jgi:DNA-3-methyladenine glycosylase I
MKKLPLVRCAWVPTGNPLFITYHDEEWGVPCHDDQKHFEFLVLGIAQAGLSWNTVLQRRSNYAKAFAQFDPHQVALYDQNTIEELLQNEGIIRNRLKIESSVKNAQLFLKIQQEYGSFDQYLWSFVNGQPIANRWQTLKEIPAETQEAKALSQDLKKKGFKFVGAKIIYAYMQSLGLVNDHTIDCFRYHQV